MDKRKEIFDNFLSQKKSERILICDKNKKILNFFLDNCSHNKIIHIKDNKKLLEVLKTKNVKKIVLVLYTNEKNIDLKIRLIAQLKLFFPGDFFAIRILNNNNKIKDVYYKVLISLGFKFLLDIKINDDFCFFYKYNISNYKSVPDWLNSDNWANPQLWEK